MTEFMQHLQEIARTLRASPETKITKSVFKSFRFSRATDYEKAFSEYLQFRRDNPELFGLPGIIAEPAESDVTPEGFKWSFEAEISGCEIGLECTLENPQGCMAILLRDELRGKGISADLKEITVDWHNAPLMTHVMVGIKGRYVSVTWEGGFYVLIGVAGLTPIRLELNEVVNLIVTSAQRAQVKK